MAWRGAGAAKLFPPLWLHPRPAPTPAPSPPPELAVLQAAWPRRCPLPLPTRRRDAVAAGCCGWSVQVRPSHHPAAACSCIESLLVAWRRVASRSDPLPLVCSCQCSCSVVCLKSRQLGPGVARTGQDSQGSGTSVSRPISASSSILPKPRGRQIGPAPEVRICEMLIASFGFVCPGGVGVGEGEHALVTVN